VFAAALAPGVACVKPASLLLRRLRSLTRRFDHTMWSFAGFAACIRETAVITSPTALLRAALVALASLPNFAAATLSGQEPPTAVIVREDFVPLDEQWQPASGNWSVSAGTYNSTAAGTTDLTRIIAYSDIASNPPTDTLRFDHFTVSARVRSRGTGEGAVGIVYQYQDAANYYEARLSTNVPSASIAPGSAPRISSPRSICTSSARSGTSWRFDGTRESRR